MTMNDSVLNPDERRQLIHEIQLNTFHHLDSDDVKWVTSWALVLASLSDRTVLRLWEQGRG